MTAVHESNYCKLYKILPRIQEIQTCRTMRLPSRQLELTVCLEESTKYTSRISFKSIFCNLVSCLPAMYLQVRMYHDARVAEVVEYQNYRGFDSRYDYPNNKMHQKNEKQQINYFLSEWLDFCIDHGFTLHLNREEIDI